jgi:hypothetical protein
MVELGFSSAEQWNNEELVEKLKTLPNVVDDDVQPKTKDSKKLLKQVLKAVDDEENLKITGGDLEEGDGEEKSDKKAKASKKSDKKASKKSKAKAEEEDEEDEEEEEDAEDADDEDEDEEEEKPKSKKKVAKGGKKGQAIKKAESKNGKGVIGTIVECLQNASKDKPVTKEQILKKLVKEFPDREEKGMKATINIQVPSRLNSEKDMGIVRHDDGGYYIKKSKKAKSEE